MAIAALLRSGLVALIVVALVAGPAAASGHRTNLALWDGYGICADPRPDGLSRTGQVRLVRDGDTLTVTYSVRNRTPNADPFYVEVFASVANGASCESIEEIVTSTNARGAAKGSFTVDVEGYVTFWVYTLGPGADDYAMTDYAYLP